MTYQSPDMDLTFRALADPTRRAILARLAEGPASVKELAAPFDMALPSLMAHLKVLEEGGLLSSEKQGRVRTCHLQPVPIKAAEAWLSDQRRFWEGRLDRLDAYAQTLTASEKGDG